MDIKAFFHVIVSSTLLSIFIYYSLRIVSSIVAYFDNEGD